MYTPRPWTVTKHKGRIEIKGNDGWESMIAHVYKSGMVNGNHYEVPAEQNADLMAAAPDLLIALEDLFEFCKRELQESPMVYLEVEGAIAKAKGMR